MERSPTEQVLSDLNNNLQAILNEVVPGNYQVIRSILRKFRSRTLKPWVIVGFTDNIHQSVHRILRTSHPQKHLLRDIYEFMKNHEMWTDNILKVQVKLHREHGLTAYVFLDVKDMEIVSEGPLAKDRSGKHRRSKPQNPSYQLALNCPILTDYTFLRTNGIAVSRDELSLSDENLLKRNHIAYDLEAKKL